MATKNKAGKAFSLLLTISIISLLLLSGPASAVTVNLEQTSESAGIHKYTAKVDLHSDDNIPLDLVAVILKDSTGTNNCYYNFNDKTKSTFSDSTLCDAVTVTSVENNAAYKQNEVNYGYGFGKGTTEGTQKTQWNNYGYGYQAGYGYNNYNDAATDGEVTITFEIDANKAPKGKEYSVRAGVAGLESEAIKFTYYNKNSLTLTTLAAATTATNEGGSGGSGRDSTTATAVPRPQPQEKLNTPETATEEQPEQTTQTQETQTAPEAPKEGSTNFITGMATGIGNMSTGSKAAVSGAALLAIGGFATVMYLRRKYSPF